MLLSNLQTVGSLQGVDRPRTSPPSPRRFTSRDQAQAELSVPGRAKRLTVTAAQPSTLPGSQTETVEVKSGAELEPTKQLQLRFGAAILPHPDKSDYGGEDAFFTSPVGGGAFGVADGVGGWQDSGINPAEYSRSFMRLACAYLEGKSVQGVTASELAAKSQGSSRGLAVTPADASLRDSPPAETAGRPETMKELTPQGALKAAHDGTRLPGSTTACVMRLNRATGCLSAANLGDSGFLVARAGTLLFRSPPLQHFFDCPLQFAAFPDYTSATDVPEDAGLFELEVQPGDVIVAGTDGLWDNVHAEDIIAMLPDSPDSMPQAAFDLAQLASKHAHDKKISSPYSQEAVKQGIDIPWILRLATATFSDGKFRLGHLKGGKIDDITVVTAYVTEEVCQPQSSPQDRGAEASAEA